jgi:PPM family protein phosphatase
VISPSKLIATDTPTPPPPASPTLLVEVEADLLRICESTAEPSREPCTDLSSPCALPSPGHGMVDVGSATSIGRRTSQEDDFLVMPAVGLFAVADGMGGHEGGEIAANLAMDTLEAEAFLWPLRSQNEAGDDGGKALRLARLKDLSTAIATANRKVWDAGLNDRRLALMGATVAAITVTPGAVLVAHAGDSRVYVCAARSERAAGQPVLFQITKDDTCNFVRDGEIRHGLTKGVGLAATIAPTCKYKATQPGDVWLLCTDGLYVLSPEVIERELATKRPAQMTADALVALALEAHASDNVTVVVVRIL